MSLIIVRWQISFSSKAGRIDSDATFCGQEVGDDHGLAALVDEALVHVNVFTSDRVSQEDEPRVDVGFLQCLVEVFSATVEDHMLELVVEDVDNTAPVFVLLKAVLEAVTNLLVILSAVIPGPLLHDRHSSGVEETLIVLVLADSILADKLDLRCLALNLVMPAGVLESLDQSIFGRGPSILANEVDLRHPGLGAYIIPNKYDSYWTLRRQMRLICGG
jgi:hypothetical protein